MNGESSEVAEQPNLNTPLVPGGSSCVTARLKDCHDGTFRFYPSTLMRLIPVFMLCISCVLFSVALFVETGSPRIMLAVMGCFPLLIAGIMIFVTKRQAVFDFNRKCYWRDRRTLRMGENPERMKDYVSFKRIASLQIIRELCHGSKGSTWYSYELNIVCQDGFRYNVVDHGGLEAVREDGRRIADALHVPLNEIMRSSNNLTRSRRQNNKLAALIAGCVFSAIGLIILFTSLIPPAVISMQAKNWKPVPAVVEKSYLDSFTTRTKSGRKTYYRIKISYTYSYNGATYRGTEYDLTRSSGSGVTVGVSQMRRIVQSHPAGKRITCYVNPSNPRKALIDRELSAAYLFDWLIFGFIMLVPVIWFILYFVLKRKERNNVDEGRKA